MRLKRDFGVRALLATIVVLGGVVGSLWLLTHGQVELGIGFLSPASMAALGFYFGQRSNGGQPS